MFGRDSISRSFSASSRRNESPPDHHAIQFTVLLPRSVDKGADETCERQDQDREEGRRRERGRRRRLRHDDDQGLNLCFHGDWVPTKDILELHFSSEGIQTSLAGQQPPPHEEDARVLTLKCNRITFPTDSSSSHFRLHTWVLIGVGLYLAGITLITVAVETYIYFNRSVLLSMEPRWREIPLSAELGRIALLYSDVASSLVDLTESAASLLSDLRDNMVPLCRHAGVLTHSIESACSEYNTVLTDAVGTLAALQIHASSWNAAGAMDGSRVEGLLLCWNSMERREDNDRDEYATVGVFSCVTELLQRWEDTDSAGLLLLAVEEAGRMEGPLRDMRARQDWIVEPFEEFLRSASSATATLGAKKVVPQSVSALVSAVRNETDPEFDRLIGRIVPWREAMKLAGAERALLEAELSVLAGAGWVT
ncbi:hypothetical protein LZ30DRAFT_785763 [Colletotrichum cereale]|nr:hypothetical protein LZ30DRAFT_785763 [Colletotrichum cereale]